MKKILAFIILSISGLSFADGNNDWQKIDENIIKLNSLNSCQGCLLRSASFDGADFKKLQAMKKKKTPMEKAVKV